MRRSLFIGLVLLQAASARADDWSLRRSASDPRAVAQIESALERAPDDAKLLARLDATAGRAALERRLAARLNEHPSATTALILGEILARHGKLDEAAAALAQAAKLADTHSANELAARIHLAAAGVETRRNHPGIAHEEAERALAATPRGAPLRRAALLQLAAKAGTPLDQPVPEALTEARALFDELLAESPGDLALHKQAGDTLAQLGDGAAGAAHWQTAARLEHNPVERANDERRAGELFAAANQLDAALAAEERALGQLPRGHLMRRQIYDAIIAVQRRRDALVEQADQWQAAWPEASRDFAEWETLARVLDEVGQPDRAIAAYQRALAKDPHAIEPRRRLIALLERRGRDADALSEWQRLVASAPGEPRYQLDYAERLARAGQKEEAQRILERVGASTSNPAVHAQLGDLYEKIGQHERAIAEAEKLVKLDPNDATRLVVLGELYLQKGQRERALAVWKRLGSDDAGPAGWQRLADVYAEHDMPGEALELYRRAVAARPGDRALAAKLADALTHMQQSAEAERIYLDLLDAAARADDRSSAAQTRARLVALLRTNDNKLLAARETNYLLRWRMASDEKIALERGLLVVDVERAQKHFDGAAEHLTLLSRQVKAKAALADVLVALADVERGRGHLDAAIAALDRATQLDPTRTHALAGLEAELLLARYRDHDALVYVQKAAAAAPDDPEAAIRLGDVQVKRNDLEAARTAYQRALTLDGQRWRVLFTLAQIDLRTAHYEEAAELYRRVVRDAPADLEEQVIDAVHRDLDLEEFLGSLDALEHELWPRADAHPDRPVYNELLLELYRREAGALAIAATAGDPTAQKKLGRIGAHALAPLLEALAATRRAPLPADALSSTPTVSSNEQAIETARLLGALGNSGAARPLLQIAVDAPAPSKPDKKKPVAVAQPPEPASLALRMATAVAGAMLATPVDRPQLLKLAHSPEKYLRAAGLFGLGRLSPSAPDALLAALDGDSDDEPAAVACIALAEHATPSIAAVIARKMADAKAAPLVRSGCAVALGYLPTRLRRPLESSLTPLLSADDPSTPLLAWALGQDPSPDTRRALLLTLFTGSAPTRSAALAALTARPSSERPALTPAPPPLTSEGDALAIDDWLDRLTHGSRLTTRTATATPTTPIEWSSVSLAPALTAALSADRARRLRTLHDLDARGDGMALGPLTRSAPSDGERAALRKLGSELVPRLTALTQAPDRAVADRARSVLAKIQRSLTGPETHQQD